MRFAPLKCLPVDRSTSRFLHEKESLYPNPSFQSSIRDIFHRGSMCSKLLFRSLRATEDNKIRVFVNSISESKIARIRGQASHLTYIVISFQATLSRRSTLKYNRFGRPCKPPVFNILEGFSPKRTHNLIKRALTSTPITRGTRETVTKAYQIRTVHLCFGETRETSSRNRRRKRYTCAQCQNAEEAAR